MSSGGELVSTEEAARTLGVTVQHVRRLAESRELTRVARGLIDRSSLERHLTARQGGRTRVWAEHTAWGAVALLSGEAPSWLGQSQASRLRGALRDMTDSADLITRTRGRATVHTFAGHPSAVARLREIMVITDSVDLGLTISADEPVDTDGYVAADTLEDMVRRFALRPDPGGDIVVRTTNFDIELVAHLGTRGKTLAALDAAVSPDPRVRGVGRRVLGEVLEGFRR